MIVLEIKQLFNIMKNLKVLLPLLLLTLIIISCTKIGDCTEVSYNTPFTIIAEETYCLPDGAELLIKSLNNEFCPCEAVCIWEGQMTLDVTWTDTEGNSTDGTMSTHHNITMPSEDIPDLLINVANVQDSITFITECNLANGNPEISQAIIVVVE